MSIRTRLLAILLPGLAVTLLLGGAAVHRIAAARLTAEFDTRLDAKVRTLASLVAFESWTLKFDGDEGAAETLDDALAFELQDEFGEILRRSDGSALAFPRRILAEDELVIADLEDSSGHRARAAWFAFRPRVDLEDDEEADPDAPPPEKAPEVITAALALDRGPIDDALGALAAGLGLAGLLVGGAAATLVGLGVRWGLRPLNRLAAALSDVEGDPLGVRFTPEATPRELTPVYRELDRMLGRVESTLERERTFAQAAAHELRTPLAELRSLAEVALRWPDPARAAEALAELLEIGGEMERITASLLVISRGEAPADAELARIADVVSAAVARRSDGIRERRLTVEVRGEGSHAVGPRDAIGMIVRNLLDNALQYTPARGSVVIEIDPPGASRRMAVTNGPVDLTQDDLPRLFEPFWRREASRAARTHAGLGLAVVRQTASAIGWRVEAHLRDGRLTMQASSD